MIDHTPDILPNLRLTSRVNQIWNYSGMDSLWSPHAESHNYPHDITYRYNSRGFRDDEWPIEIQDLRSAFWCIGDSFTVGIGSPEHHIWPQVLQAEIGVRTINVSMDGASNQWISRTAKDIATAIAPQHMVVMWSYLTRRESNDCSQSDEDRRVWCTKCSDHEDLDNFRDCVQSIHSIPSQLYQFMIPNAHKHLDHLAGWHNVTGPDWPPLPRTKQDFQKLPVWVVKELKKFGVYEQIHKAVITNAELIDFCLHNNIHLVQQLDWARDCYHFDIQTSNSVVNKIKEQYYCS
jgi:hypothetical protein